MHSYNECCCFKVFFFFVILLFPSVVPQTTVILNNDRQNAIVAKMEDPLSNRAPDSLENIISKSVATTLFPFSLPLPPWWVPLRTDQCSELGIVGHFCPHSGWAHRHSSQFFAVGRSVSGCGPRSCRVSWKRARVRGYEGGGVWDCRVGVVCGVGTLCSVFTTASQALSSYLFTAYSHLSVCLSSSMSGEQTSSCKFAKWWTHLEVVAFFSHLFLLRHLECNLCQRWECIKGSVATLVWWWSVQQVALGAQLFLIRWPQEGSFAFCFLPMSSQSSVLPFLSVSFSDCSSSSCVLFPLLL